MGMGAAFGIDMLGKLATNLSDTYGTGNTLRAKQREEAQGDYLERERLGIQAKVEGAKAAGLHPLAALGAQSSNSPSTIIGSSEAPRSHAPQPEVQAAERDPNIDRYNAARARLAEAEATKAERDLAASTARLASQPGNGPGVLPTSSANLRGSKLKPGIIVKPDEVVAGAGGVTAGTHPGMTAVESPGVDNPFMLPSTQASQQMEDMDLLKYYLTYKANQESVHKTLLGMWPGQWALQKGLDYQVKRNLERWANSKSRLSRPKLR